MKVKGGFKVVAILFTTLLLLVKTTAAFAHGSTTIGDYTIEIGFKNEPAIQGEMNGLDLIVTNTKTEKPVTGLQDSLKAEIIFGASKKTLNIEPVEGEDGAYTAAMIPTAVGDYTWHIFGKIEETPIDISMTSSPTTFVSVDPPSTISIPGSEASVTTLETALAQANQRATIGMIAGIVGILIGIISLVIALTRSARRV